MTQVHSITQANFNDDVLNSPLPVVVDFHAPWCGPCRRLAPTLEKLSEVFEGQIKFVKINTDDNPELARQYQITSLPTLLLMDAGQISSQVTGFVPEAELESGLRSWLDNRNPSHP